MKLYHKILLLLFFLIFSLSVNAAEYSGKIVISKIKEMYSLNDENYEIEILSNPLKSENIISEKMVIRALTQKEPIGLFTVLVNIIENDKIVETAQVRLRIKKFADVLTVTGKIKRHKIIDADNTTVQRKDITKLFEKPLVSVEETKGMRVKRNLKKGAILTAEALEPIPDIESGMETTIVYNDGYFKITASGVALQTGIAGDYIKVKNKTTKKIIIARIVDKKFVAIDP